MFVRLLENPFTILLLPVAIIFSIIIYKKPVIGIYISTFLIPFEDLTSLSSNLTIIKISLAYTFIVWIVKVIISHKRILINQVGFIILFCFWSILSLGWSYNLSRSIDYLSTFLQLILLLILVINLLRKKQNIEHVMMIFIIACFFAAIISLIQLAIGVEFSQSRASLFEGQNPNGFSRSLGIGLLLIAYFLFNYSSKKSILLFISGAFLLMAIIFAQSKGTIVSLIASLFFLLIFSKSHNKYLIIIMVIASSFGIYLIFPELMNNFVIPRISLLIYDPISSLTGRDLIWKIGYEMIKDNPIIGVGFGNFTAIYGFYSLQYRGWYAETDPHSVFVAIQAELGLIGSVIFVLFLFSIIRRSYSVNFSQFSQRIWVLSLLLYLFIGSISTSVHYSKYYWLAFGIIISFINLEEFCLSHVKVNRRKKNFVRKNVFEQIT